MNLTNIIISYFIGINIVALILMGVDKERAITKRWRIKEKNLFLVAMIGGSVGSIIGMQIFRHKTKHIKFKIGMPLILSFQIALMLCFKIWGLL